MRCFHSVFLKGLCQVLIAIISIIHPALGEETEQVVLITPPSLSFESRIGDPALLSFDVDTKSNPPARISTEVEGFKCDRRIIATGSGTWHVEVAPDTSTIGTLQGSILVKTNGKLVATIPVTGNIAPWIRLQPSRLFVGSMGHGAAFSKPGTYSLLLTSDNEPFDIQSIDFQNIAGTHWESDPKPGIPSLRKRLTLSFSPDALAAGFPFGALARKEIVIRTSHPKALQVMIPVMGMLSVNTTGRDYSQYLYKGEVRWKGLWATPNFAAAFVSTATILLCTIAACLHSRFLQRLRWRVPLAVCAAIGMAYGCDLLVRTYSRGGWVGMAVGLAVVLVVSRRTRFYPFGLALIFAASIALHPAGLKRVSSSTEVSEDKSIGHRLLLWQGAFQMMAEHPWSGVGAGQFGKEFKKDYQLPTHTDDYSTAINDYLTFGTERGIPLLAVLLGGILTILLAAVFYGFQRKSQLLAGCSGAAVCYLTCGWFSSIIFHWNPSYLVVIALSGIAAWAIWRGFSAGGRRIKSLFFRAATGWLILSAALVIGCLIAGAVALSSRPASSNLTVAGMHGIEMKPRYTRAKGTIIYIDDHEDKDLLSKSTLRPLARDGWDTICFEQPTFASDALGSLSSAIANLRESGRLKAPWYIVGHKRGAELALALAAANKPTAAACYLTPGTSPFPDLSPITQVAKIGRPVLLSAQNADSGRSSENLAQLLAAAHSAGSNPVEEIHQGEFSVESPRWQQWIEAVDTFAEKHTLSSPERAKTAH